MKTALAQPPNQTDLAASSDPTLSPYSIAGFWCRASAFLLDAAFASLLSALLLALALGREFSRMEVAAWLEHPLQIWSLPVFLLACLMLTGTTPAKALLGIRLLEADTGAPCGRVRLLWRLVGYALSALPAGLGFLWIALDRQARAWHDHFAGTVAVRVQGDAGAEAANVLESQTLPQRAPPPGLHYQDEGARDAPVLVLLHSLALNLHAWNFVMPALLQSFRVVRADLRGHGQSSVTSGRFSLGDLAADVGALLEHLHIERAHLCGLSVGGMVAQCFALLTPEKLQKLVICATLCETPKGGERLWQQRIRQVQEAGLEPQVQPTLERWFPAEFRQEQGALLESVRAMIRATPPQGYIGMVAALAELNRYHLPQRLPSLRVPTLVLAGAQDGGTPPEATRRIAELIPGAEFHCFAHSAHQIALTEPEAFAQILSEFLLRAG